MPRIELQKYINNVFKNERNTNKFYKISGGHVINSDGYDVQFSRFGLLYRDMNNNIRFSIEHDINHKIIIYVDSFLEGHNKPLVNIERQQLITRVTSAIDFLNIKCVLE